MNPQLESIKQQALAINDTLNTKAAAEGKATQTFNAQGQVQRQAPNVAPTVPVAAIESTQPPLTVPTPTLDPSQALQTATTGAQGIVDADIAAKSAELEAAKTTETTTDSRLKELFGVMGQAPAIKKQLEDEAGLQEKQRLVNAISAKAGLVSDNRQLFDLATPALSYQMQLEASKNDITKGTFNAMDSRLRMERALESNAQAAELVGLNAQYQMASGDVRLAQESVAQAMDIFYTPIKQELEMEKMFFQRNSQRMSDAQRNLAAAQDRKIDVQLQEIQDAKVNVSAAVASGYASADDIARMTELAGDPEAQNNYANQIIAKAARTKLAEERAAKAAANSATSWTQRAQAYELALLGDPQAIAELGFDPRAAGMTQQEAFDYQNKSMDTQEIFNNITEILNNPQGIKASTGFGLGKSVVVQSALTYGLGSAGAGTIAGSFTGPGAAITGVGAGILGTIGGIQAVGNQKINVLSSLSSLTNTATFQEMRRLKEAGLTFGALTEGERIAIGKAADDLFSAVSVADDGAVTGINVSEDRFRTLLTNYQQKAKTYQEQLDIISGKVNSADEELINSLGSNLQSRI